MLQLLDLPDELLCEILAYLSPFDAICSFSNLNKRFNRLLSPFQNQIDLTHLSYGQFHDYIDRFLPQLSEVRPLQILKLGNQCTPGQIDLFNRLLGRQRYFKYFGNVHSVTIESPRLEELSIFVEKFLLILPQLDILRLKIDYIRDEQFQKWTQLIVNSILSIASLKKLSIDMPSGLVLSRLSNRIVLNLLTDVRLNVTLVTDLLLLIPHIPNVEILLIRISWWTSADRTMVKMLEMKSSNDTNATVHLTKVKRFQLSIDSILTFNFLHLEQLANRILHSNSSQRFSFNLRNCLNYDNHVAQLLNGQRWETFLTQYANLDRFDLFIRMATSIDSDELRQSILSFNSDYFRQHQWTFSHWKATNPDQHVLFSIPYRHTESFEIILGDDRPPYTLTKNYASTLSIDQSWNETCPLNNLTFHWIVEQFPMLEEIRLIRFHMNFSLITQLHLPSLHRLHMEKERSNDVEHLLSLLPFINTLSLSFSTIFHQNSSPGLHQYDRIVNLSVMAIPAEGIEKTLDFAKRFPNVRSLYIHIINRRMINEHLLGYLNTIINMFNALIHFKLQLEKNIDDSINLQTMMNGRMKTYLIDTIFDGVLIHFWF